MKYFLMVVSTVLLLISSSCYHARIETGLSPSAKVVDKPFASSWIYGLVPPSTVKAAMECTDGVAVVETRLSFVNQLVGAITFGIYTPMHIRVTCASGGGSAAVESGENLLLVNQGATEDEKLETLALAVKQSMNSHQPVYVYFE